MMKILKKILIILVLTITTFYTLDKVIAQTTVKYEDVVEETHKYEEDDTPQPPFHTIVDNTSTTSYTCSMDRTLWDEAEDVISVYNQDNVDIIGQGFKMTEKPLAGTAVGLTIKERRYGKIAIYGITVRKSSTTTIVSTTTKTTTEYICKYETLRIQDVTNPQEPSATQADYEPPQCTLPDKKVSSTAKCYIEIPAECGVKETVATSTTTTTSSTVVKTADKSYVFDFTSGQTQLTADSVKDAEVIKSCLDSKAAWLSNAGNWGVYSEASYDIMLTDSNNVSATTDVLLNRNEARKTSKYYNLSGDEISCGNDACRFRYESSRLEGTTVYPGRFYVLSTDQVIDSNPYLSYLITYFYYEKKTTCLNVKTGEVYYISPGNDEKCDSNSEFEIPNEVVAVDDYITLKDGKIVQIKDINETHWHYFIPLNAKSNDGIKFVYQDEYTSGRSVGACQSAMKKYYILSDNQGTDTGDYKYTEVIRPKTSGEKFIGDYVCLDKCGTDEAVFRSYSSDLKRIEDEGGCYSAGEHSIETKQLFYNENNTTNATGTSIIKFNGFNFYYRPIDITNVFPNGIASASLWTEWESDPDPKLDISKSYSVATYVAHNISANDVRKYNKNNPYTSWDKMNTNGTSQYVETSGVITRTSDAKVDTIYKLGCGPANKYEYLKNSDGSNKLDAEGNKIENPLYQEECVK